MAEYKLTYFDIKGVSETMRLLFALAKVPYQDIRIPHNPNPVGGAANRFPPDIRQKLPYGQVPILEFDGVVLSQSAAIGRFLAGRFRLLGSDDIEKAKVDEIIDALKDYVDHFKWRPWRPVKNPEEKAAGVKILIETTTSKYLGKFDSILEANGGKFLVGKSWTWADVMLYHVITYYGQFIDHDLVKSYPAFQGFVKAFEEEEGIKEWLRRRPSHTTW